MAFPWLSTPTGTGSSGTLRGLASPERPAQFSRAMDELGIQVMFALSPQVKARVERTAGTFQDRLVTELRLAGANSIGEANGVLEQFLPRYNRRFRVPPQCSESAYRPVEPALGGGPQVTGLKRVGR